MVGRNKPTRLCGTGGRLVDIVIVSSLFFVLFLWWKYSFDYLNNFKKAKENLLFSSLNLDFRYSIFIDLLHPISLLVKLGKGAYFLRKIIYYVKVREGTCLALLWLWGRRFGITYITNITKYINFRVGKKQRGVVQVYPPWATHTDAQYHTRIFKCPSRILPDGWEDYRYVRRIY